MAIGEKAENKLQVQRTSYNKLALSFLMGVVIGSGATWFIFGSVALSPVVLPGSSNLTLGGSAANSTPVEYVIVENQLAGDRVLIKEISLTVSGWAVVHEDAGDTAGNALGAQRFDGGVHSGTVDLLRNTQVGQGYYVLLYKDNGDREFDLETDTLITDAETSPIKSTFQVIRIDRKIN